MRLFEPDRTYRNKAQLIWTLVWFFCTGVGLYLSPDSHGHGTHQQLGLPPCPSVLLFNRPCPGCGLTTSWTSFIHGNFTAAFSAHPLGIPMYLLLTYVGVGSLWGNLRGKRLLIDTTLANRIFIGVVALFFIFGAIRMTLTPNFAATDKELLWRGVTKTAPASER
jgi:hypothetical protein